MAQGIPFSPEERFEMYLQSWRGENRFNLDLSFFVKGTQGHKILCPIHNIQFETTTDRLRHGGGCHKCVREKKGWSSGDSYDTKSFIKKAKTKHLPERYSYELVEYVDSRVGVTIICNVCGNVFDQSPRAHLQGQGCPECARGGPSKGHLFVRHYLKSLGIDFEEEFQIPNPIKKIPLSYDFVLHRHEVLIEFDGSVHVDPAERYGGREGLRKRKARDAYKDKWADENNYALFRIDFSEDWEGQMAEVLYQLELIEIHELGMYDD